MMLILFSKVHNEKSHFSNPLEKKPTDHQIINQQIIPLVHNMSLSINLKNN